MAWLVLVVAGLLETVWALALKESDVRMKPVGDLGITDVVAAEAGVVIQRGIERMLAAARHSRRFHWKSYCPPFHCLRRCH